MSLKCNSHLKGLDEGSEACLDVGRRGHVAKAGRAERRHDQPHRRRAPLLQKADRHRRPSGIGEHVGKDLAQRRELERLKMIKGRRRKMSPGKIIMGAFVESVLQYRAAGMWTCLYPRRSPTAITSRACASTRASGQAAASSPLTASAAASTSNDSSSTVLSCETTTAAFHFLQTAS